MVTLNRGTRRTLIAGLLVVPALILAGCGTSLPVTDEPVAPQLDVRIKVPAETLDATITHIYAQSLENNSQFNVILVEEDHPKEAFFDEENVSATMNQLKQNEVDIAVLRAGQALHITDPNSSLIPLPNSEQATATTPSPWPSTASQKISELPESLPATVNLGNATEAVRGAELLMTPAALLEQDITNAAEFTQVCEEFDVVVQDNFNLSHIKTELQALYECIPASITAVAAPRALTETLAGEYDLAVLDSANPHGWDKGLTGVDGVDLLRPDSYVSLVSTHQFDDPQVQQLQGSLGEISARLDDAELVELYRFVYEEPTMTTTEAATWWLQRQGLSPEEP